MANLASSDIAVTLLNRDLAGPGRYRVLAKLVFGDGALTYPAGGVPLARADLGLPNEIQSLKIFDKGTSGYEWLYDRVNGKLVAMQSAANPHTHGVPAGTHDLFLKNADQADGVTTRSNAASNKLGMNTGSSETVTGVLDILGSGGIVADAGATTTPVAGESNPLAQPSAVAIAAQTLYVEALGW